MIRRRSPLTLRWAILATLVACADRGTLPVDADPAADSGDSASPGPAVVDTGDPADTGDGPPPFALLATVALADGVPRLTTNLPARVGDCEDLTAPGAPCADRDLDGLTDAWEDLVLARFRPAIRFDEQEPFLADPDAVLVDVARVARAEDGGIRVRVMMGYHRDYGRCGLSAHHGDSERVVLDLEPLGPTDVILSRAYTAAHEDTLTDKGRVFAGGDLGLLEFPPDPGSGEPRWLVYSSDGKHATYGSAQLCEDAEWAPCLEEDCDADGTRDLEAFTTLPPVHNAGEPDEPLLTDLAPLGLPGEDAWADQDFCGGLGRNDPCASSVREKLLDDPF